MAEVRVTKRINARWWTQQHINAAGKPMLKLRIGEGHDVVLMLHSDEVEQLVEVLTDHLNTAKLNTGGINGDDDHELRGRAADRMRSVE